MRVALWTIYIGFLVAGLRRFLSESHDRMQIRWFMESCGNGYSTVRVAMTYTVVYSHMRNGTVVHSIAHIARRRVREFRYKGDVYGHSIILWVTDEMHRRARVDYGKIISYEVVLVNLNSVQLFVSHDESDIPKDVIAEVDRVEKIFMSLPRTIK